jgi:AAA domain
VSYRADEIDPTPGPPQIPDATKLKKCGLYTPSALDHLVQQERSTDYILEGYISRGSVNIAVGDSGLGKSPLFYQLGLSIAAGKPWLGLQTIKGPVIYFDLENSERDSKSIIDSLTRHLDLGTSPANFLTHYGGETLSNKSGLVTIVKEVRPALVIIDSLRAYRPECEKDNTEAGKLLKGFRALGKTYQTAFLLIHHIRKPGENGVPPLEETPANQWLNQASGARALINQTDFRLAIDSAAGAGRRLKKTNPSVAEEMALILRGHVRVRGQFGPIYVSRAFGPEGQPIGYTKVSTVDLLDNSDQQQALGRLPNRFSFKDAKQFYGRQDQATSDFLDKCIRLDLIRRSGKGQYEKIESQSPSGVIGV